MAALKHGYANSLQRILFFELLLTVSGSLLKESIINPPSDITSNLGRTIQFNCTLKSGVLRTLTWTFNENDVIYSVTEEKEYLKGEKYSVTHRGWTSILQIKNVNYRDAGTYTCSGMTVQARARLMVLGNIQVLTDTPNPVEGDRGTYTCKAPFGGPNNLEMLPEYYPRLSMFLDGRMLQTTVHFSNHEDCYVLSLNHEMKFNSSYEGKELSCEIRTSKPEESKTEWKMIKLLYPPRHCNYVPHRRRYEIGAQINCTADGNPKPNIHWENNKDGLYFITKQMVGNNSLKCTASNIIRGQPYKCSVIAEFEVVTRAELKDHDKIDSSWKLQAIIFGSVCIVAVVGIIAGTIMYINANHAGNYNHGPQTHSLLQG